MFLSESESSIPTMQISDETSIVAITSGVKPGRRVDDDRVAHRPQRGVDVTQEVDRDRTRLVGPRRRDEHLDAGGVRDQVPVELLVVERRAGLHQVVHRPLGREPEREADVAELEVEVDEDDVRVALGERDREVRRDERLPGAALRPEDRR